MNTPPSKHKTFLFTPAEFLAAMNTLAKECFPGFSCTFLNFAGSLAAELFWTPENSQFSLIRFFDPEGFPFLPGDRDRRCVWSIQLQCAEATSGPVNLIQADKIRVFFQALDSSLCQKDIRKLQNIFLPFFHGRTGLEFSGMHPLKSGAYYMLSHGFYQDGSTDVFLSTQSIQIYASESPL